MKIITKDTFGNESCYEVVEKMPNESNPIGYRVWNIGENMGSDEYIPICRTLPADSSEDPYHVDMSSVRAIKLPKPWVKTLRQAAGKGYTNITETNRLRGEYDSLADKALKIFKVISEGYVPSTDYVPFATRNGEIFWEYGELKVKRLSDGKTMTLTQKHVIAKEDYYTINRCVCDYDNLYVYEVMFMGYSDGGTVLTTVYLDEESLIYAIGDLKNLLHGDVGTRLNKYFREV